MKPNQSLLLHAVFYLLAACSFNSNLFAQTVTRGAYLQKGGQTSITIRWNTDINTNSRVRIGTTYDATGNYPTIINDAASVTVHTVNVTGLTADTKYFYSVGSSTAVLQVETSNFFTTAPLANTTRKIRIAAFGDCGREGATGTTNQTNSLAGYKTFLTANSIDAPDAWLLLGDNAYDVGSDAEYGTKFFTPYTGGTNKILRNHKLYPTPGNHEYNYSQATVDRTSRAWPYFNIFNFPQGGDCGGTASGVPNFYSYDIGNIHFLSLDSHGMESSDGNSQMGTNSATTVMKNWITADLAANTKKWVIAYWHHPPYSKGSHNSDAAADQQMIDIRTNFIAFLEQKGVDLILGGHSHAYERSRLVKGYTGSWAGFVPATHSVSNLLTAKWDGAANSAPFKYNSSPLDHGTVYVVAGNAGAVNSSTTGFAGANSIMPWATTSAGTFYLEIEDNRLDGRMINAAGGTFDKFTIIKDGGNKSTTYNIVLGQSQVLNASWPNTNGTYVWTGTGASGTNRSTSVTPATTGTFLYTVADNTANSGLLDNITVNVSGTLPVTFTNFTAQKQRAGVAINWSVAEVSSHDYFSVERSTDGIRFTEINRNNDNINGLGSRSFTLNDINLPSADVLYYRIKQCDINGSCKYTDIKAVRFDEKNKIVLYPVPADNTVNVIYTNAGGNTIEISITDQSGIVVMKEIRTVTPGRNNMQLNIEKLKTGNYVVIINDGKEKSTERLIKL
jgi:acid phosphatase type 7